MTRVRVLMVVAAALAGSNLRAQPERYELGRRLKEFERAWDQENDADARKRALAVLPRVTKQFFSVRFGEAARALDEARFALSPATSPTSETKRWMTSLHPVPARRLLDASEKSVTVTIRTMYPVKAADAGKAKARVSLQNGGTADPATGPFAKPTDVAVPLYPAEKGVANWGWDERVTLEVGCEGEVTRATVTVSRVANLRKRLAALRVPADLPPIEAATLADHIDLLTRLADGAVVETDVPAANLILQAEGIHAAAPKPYFTRELDHIHRITVPTGKDTRTACRIFVPRGLDAKRPVPVVVALHGAGGSENLFFEGYGDGFVRKECEKRGWLLVAPRSPLGIFGGPPPVAEILETLTERYPIDPSKVFVVGHSMGAAQAIELAQQRPGKFRAVAVLGGAGRVRKPEPFADLPVFIGVGSEDFALGGSRGLRDAMTKAGAKAVTHKEYPGLEHLVIVREALPDVFAQWDGLAK